MFFTISCQAELNTHINCDLAVMTVLWLLSLTPETSLLDSCSKTCVSLHKLFIKTYLPSYCTLLHFVNFSLKIWWMDDGAIYEILWSNKVLIKLYSYCLLCRKCLNPDLDLDSYQNTAKSNRLFLVQVPNLQKFYEHIDNVWSNFAYRQKNRKQVITFSA